MRDKYIAYIEDNKVKYFDLEMKPMYMIEHSSLPQILQFAETEDNKLFYALTGYKVMEFMPNLSTIDIAIIKNIVRDGVVAVKDDHGSLRNISLKGCEIKRIQMKNESRYEVKMSGLII